MTAIGPLMACSGGTSTAPSESLAPSTFITDAAPAGQALVAFSPQDSSRCLGLQDSELTFTTAAAGRETRHYLMPPTGGVQIETFETLSFTYSYDASTGTLILRRGTAVDTGTVAAKAGRTELDLRERFHSSSACHQAEPAAVVYFRAG